MDDVSVGGYDTQQQQMHHVQIQQPHEMFVTAISAINPTMVSTVSDMPPKISTPSVLQNRIGKRNYYFKISPLDGAQIDQRPISFYVVQF